MWNRLRNWIVDTLIYLYMYILWYTVCIYINIHLRCVRPLHGEIAKTKNARYLPRIKTCVTFHLHHRSQQKELARHYHDEFVPARRYVVPACTTTKPENQKYHWQSARKWEGTTTENRKTKQISEICKQGGWGNDQKLALGASAHFKGEEPFKIETSLGNNFSKAGKQEVYNWKNTNIMLPLFWNFEKHRLSTSWTSVVFSHPTPLICNPQLLIKSCNGSRPVSGDAILLKHPGCVKLWIIPIGLLESCSSINYSNLESDGQHLCLRK